MMASTKLLLAYGGSNNKPPFFVDEYYDFLEDFHANEEIWDVVENGLYVPTMVMNEVEQIKVKGSWNEDDKKIVLFDKMLRTFLHHP